MIKIKYYPVIDCDTDGAEKVAMIPTPNGDAVKSRSSMWLEEMVPHYFRLHTKGSSKSADTFTIRCPRCSTALKQIGANINETKRGLYVCSACAKKQGGYSNGE